MKKKSKNKNNFDNIIKILKNFDNTTDVKANALNDNETDSLVVDLNRENIAQSIISFGDAEEKNDNLKTGLYNIENYDNFSFVGIEDSWLQIISTDGEMFYTGMVKKGDNLIVPNDERLLITLRKCRCNWS